MAEADAQGSIPRRPEDQGTDRRRPQVLVLDASAALAWSFSDERDGLPDSLLDVIEGGAAIVPAHWVLEVTNGLLLASRRKRLQPLEHLEILARIGVLPIRVDPETVSRGWFDTLALAEEFGLTTYDAAYLELALRLQAPLVTLDAALAEAAHKAGLPRFY